MGVPPIFCLVVLQRASVPLVRNKFLGVAALVFSLALLSLSQAVLFVMTVIAIGLAEVWNLARYRHGQAVVVLLGLGISDCQVARGILRFRAVSAGWRATRRKPPSTKLCRSGRCSWPNTMGLGKLRCAVDFRQRRIVSRKMR